MLTFVGFLYSYYFFVFFVCVFVGAIEMHSQLMIGACCVCICFICLLKVNNQQVFSFFGACVSVLPWDLRVLLDVLCCPIHHSLSYGGGNSAEPRLFYYVLLLTQLRHHIYLFQKLFRFFKICDLQMYRVFKNCIEFLATNGR